MNTKQLLKYSLFDGLDESELNQFLNIIDNKKYKANNIIINENEDGDSVMLLLDGTVTISKALTIKIDQIEQPEKEFTKLNANQYPFFGEVSIFNPSNKRTATIIADTNCTIGILKNKNLIKVCEDNAEIGYKIMKNISKKLINDLLITNRQVLKLTTAFSLIIEKQH
tara:strand:- start:91 stop:594 length:504 start_codon:yes stop_codon:yes gene_type:complete